MYKLITTKNAVFLVILVIIGAGAWFYFDSAEDKTTQRTIRYSYTLHNPTDRLLENARFYVYLPVASSSHFDLGNIKTNYPYTNESDEMGNRIIAFKLEKFAPLSSKVISITARLDIYASSRKQRIDNPDIYLAEEKYVELQASELTKLATRLDKNNTLKTGENIFAWVSRNIEYQGYVSQDRGALAAYNTRQGDCTEYMYLFTALSRLSGIPTRNVGGFVVREDSLLRAEDFHNWSEIYLDGKWRVVDPQNRQFLTNESAYIGMRIIADQQSDQPSPFNSHRFFVSNGNIQVTMN